MATSVPREKSSSALGLSAWLARCSGRVAGRGRGRPSRASRATSTSPWSRSQSAAIAAGGRLLLPSAHSWMRTLPSRSTRRASPVLVGCVAQSMPSSVVATSFSAPRFLNCQAQLVHPALKLGARPPAG